MKLNLLINVFEYFELEKESPEFLKIFGQMIYRESSN